ncbi:MAG: Kelch repeat-containing protein [Acidimicrobiia bacterium]
MGFRETPDLLRLALAALLALAACSSGGGDGSARPTRPPEPGAFPDTPLPQGRTEVAGALWGGRIAIAGGFTADGAPSSRLDLLDEDGDWSRGPDLPAAYDHASLAVLDRRLWLVGGVATRDGEGRATAAVSSLGRGEDEWREEASLQEPRSALATVAAEGMLVAIGGANDRGVLRSTEIYDPADGEWRRGPALAVPREHTAAAAVGETVYAIAGRQGTLESNLTSVESLGLPDGEWRPEPSLRFSRGGTAAAALDGRPCVAGGEEPGGTIPSVECLGEEGWREVAALVTPRHGLAMVAAGGELHVIGGGPQPGLFVSDAHEVLDA